MSAKEKGNGRSQNMKIRGTLRMLHRVGLRPARGNEEKGIENHAKGGGQWEHEPETTDG